MLYLWMPEANGVWLWSRGEKWMPAATLEQLIQAIQLDIGEDAVVFFPSRDVQILQQQLSKAQYKQLGPDGLKYLLEEYVIQPIDLMKVYSHFKAPDQVSILGIAQHSVTTIQHALSLIPVKIVALLPDFLVLPTPEPNQIVLANIHGRLLLRDGEYTGNSVDDLSVALAFLGAEKTYLYSDLSDGQFNCLSAVSTAEQRQTFDVTVVESKRIKNHPFNVLPKQKKTSKRESNYWKACAVLVVCVLLSQFSYDLLRWVKLKKNADQTAQIAIDQYKSWFGANERVTEQNLTNVFESRLRESKGANTQALQLLSRIGPILMQQQIIAQRVRYQGAVLDMDLQAKSSEALKNLVEQLNKQGFKAELGNIQTQGDVVVGMVKIQ